MFSKRWFILAGILVASSLAVAQVVDVTPPVQDDAFGSDAIAILTAEPERLSAEFERLGNQTLTSAASASARKAFVSFLRTELMPYLTAAVVVYPVADSVGSTNGYAVASALFDGEAIARLVKELEGIAGSQDVVAFRVRAFALGELLDLFFTKQRTLVAPLFAQLSEMQVQAVVKRIEAERDAIQKS